jgi:hypothetical protein
MALEPTYDEWLDSPYPAQGITCQSCHMPPTPARLVDSDLPRSVRSHGGSPGAPSSLPGLADDGNLLRQAATLDVDWEIRSETATLLATVSITNSGAGHHLPTGAADLRRMWLEVTLRDDAGEIVWGSGQLDAFGALDPDAVQFRKVLGDANGRPIELHRIWVATQVLSDTSLAPQETRQISYQLPLPASAPATFALTVRLLYRDVSQGFAEFALDRAVTDLPVWEMAKAEVEVGIGD